MLYLITFDLHGAEQPPGNLYAEIYRSIENHFGDVNFCKDFGQFCLVRSDGPASKVKEAARLAVDKKSNQFKARDIVVFSLGDEISISRGRKDDDLREFRKFFVQPI
jgi:hypothetical protein